MATHLAAVSLAKGERFEVRSRPTPKPGPGELLIQVKSVAINPADGHMRDTGLLVSSYPAVLGFDISGLVLEVGDGSSGPFFRAGITRVAAYVAYVWKQCNPDYGAFQERCLVPWQHAAPLQDETISWNEAATLPVAVEVPLNAWDVMGIPRLGEAETTTAAAAATAHFDNDERERGSQQNKTHKRQALLIWGASSSVGTMGVQSARLLREDGDSSFAVVYATAGEANHKYISSLGADRVFDYKDPQVVEAIVSAAKEDGVVIAHCFLATGQLAPCQAVLQAFTGDDRGSETQRAKIATAPPIPPDAEEVNGVETIFVLPSMTDEGERLAQFQYWMGTWLRKSLANGSIRPSPEPKVVGRGLEALNAGVDEIVRGVSCTKLVVEVAQ